MNDKGEKMSNTDDLLQEISKQFNITGQIHAGGIFAALIIAMVMGFVLSKIYKLYFGSSEPTDYGIGNSFLLMMPAVTSIFILIQYSLPLSLGLLGALSFVRFRTPVKRAEDISFILLAISISLSCAVQYYHVAIFLILIVAIYATVRTRISAFNIFDNGATLVTIRDKKLINFSDVIDGLPSKFGEPNIVNSQNSVNYCSIVFTVKGHKANMHSELTDVLKNCLQESVSIDIFYPGNEITA